MKRLTLFVAALVVAMGSFATVVYEPNGGVATNDYGWQGKQDMWAGLNTDVNAAENPAGVKTWDSLAVVLTYTDPVAGQIPTWYPSSNVPSRQGVLDVLQTPKWKWLFDYIDAKRVEDGKAAYGPTGTNMVFDLAAFFVDGQRTGWPAGPSFASCGISSYDTWKDSWKMAFANPTEPKETFTLNAPYLEGKFFAGWFDNKEFSGEPVITVDSTTTGTLYAKWYDFPIVTISEALALEDSTECSVQGTITFVDGSNLWMQDTKAAINVCHKNSGLKAGDKVIFKDAIKTVRYGIPQISEADSIIIEGNDPIKPVTVTIANILADTTDAYLNHYVYLNGLKATWSGDSLFFKEDANKIYVYKSGITATDLPEGQKLDAYVVVSSFSNNTVTQFRTKLDLVTKTGLPLKDTYAYPARGDKGQYTLTNKWLYSNVLDNFLSNKPNGQPQYVRGMAVKEGKMYFIDREFDRLVVVDGETGIMLDPVYLAKNAWTKEVKDSTGAVTTVASKQTYKNNDIKIDAAGNLLVGPCATAAHDFQIWKIDEKTGAATCVINDHPQTTFKNDSLNWRVDAFGVYGNVDESAIIMAANAQGHNVLKYTIENGKHAKSELLDLYIAATENSYLLKDGEMIEFASEAPQVYIVDETYFYLDIFHSYPTLFDMSSGIMATFADDFKSCPSLKVGNLAGDTTTIDTQQNGLVEFQIGEEYYLLMVCGGTASGNNFALLKYANEERAFAEMTPMWCFPNAGLGTATNGARTAVPYVEVNQETGLAKIYIFAADNGYGMYEFQGSLDATDAVENIFGTDDVKVQKVMRDGQVIIIRNGVEYNVLGAQL